MACAANAAVSQFGFPAGKLYDKCEYEWEIKISDCETYSAGKLGEPEVHARERAREGVDVVNELLIAGAIPL